MVKVGEQGIFLSDTAAKRLSPYILSQFKKTLVLDLNALQSFTESDPVFTAWLAIPPNVSTFTNDSGYLTSFSETDPIYTTSSWYSTTNNSSNWDTAFSWGNHASAGYLTSITSGQVTAALGYTPYDATNPSGYITSSSLSSYVPTARTLTINGTTYDLTADRSWTISTGTTYTFSTGLTDTAGTITSNLSTGVSGGQSVVGGTSSGNNLTLSSTSNATKGKILFGTSAYDEVNNSLGIGRTNPGGILDIYKSDNANPLLMRIWNGGSGGAKLRFVAETGGTAQHQWTTDKFLAAIAANNTIGMQFRVGLNATEAALDASTRMTITTDGNVGIGTTTPARLLSVGSNGSGFELYRSGASTNDSFKATSNNLGASFGTQNLNSSGFSGVEYIDSAGSLAVFTGYNNAGREFRFNNVATSGYITFKIASSDKLTIANNGNVGVGQTSPTAVLHIKAGTASAGTAPIKLTSGTNLTTAEAGAMEYNGTSLFFTRSGTLRAGILMTDLATPFNTYTASAKGATAFTSGTDNFLGGYFAGGSLAAGSQNVMIGTQAGNFSNSGLINSVMIGYFAGQSASGLTSGAVFIGSQAGQNSANATNSIFIGQLCGFNSVATNAIFIGNTAGNGATNANDSVGIGQNAARNATGSIQSIYLGTNTGYNTTGSGITGDYNIAIGSTSARALTTGSKNVLLGYSLEAQSNTADGQLTIQNAIFGTGNIGTGTTASTGNIGIYVVAPSARLHLPAGTAAANTAPLKLTSGINLTTPEDGTFEFDGTNLYFTTGGVRKTVTLV